MINQNIYYIHIKQIVYLFILINQIYCSVCKKEYIDNDEYLSKQFKDYKDKHVIVVIKDDDIDKKYENESKIIKKKEIEDENIDDELIEYKYNRIPVGLNNLGNTCFFNSALQNLANTKGLYDVYLHYKSILTNCPITNVFYKTILSMMNGNRTISPNALFNKVGNINKRFRGYHQQDAQELYHVLIDAIDTENKKNCEMVNDIDNVEKDILLNEYNSTNDGYRPHNLIKNISYYFDISEDTEVEMGERDEELYVKNIEEKEEKSIQTSISDLVFGGQYCTIIQCQKCLHKSRTFTKFYDLSLALPKGKTIEIKHYSKVLLFQLEKRQQSCRKTKKNSRKTIYRKYIFIRYFNKRYIREK